MFSAIGTLALLAAVASPNSGPAPTHVPPPPHSLEAPGTTAASSVSPDVTGAAGYYYATAFDQGNASGHPGENISYEAVTDGQSVPSNTVDHSITEMYVRDASGDAVEIGIVDAPEAGWTSPTLFVTSWSNGSFNGWNEGSTGFVSTSSQFVPGSFRPPLGSWYKYQIVFSGGQVKFYIDNHEFGYIPAGFFPGGYTGNVSAQVYGEVYSQGGTLPTMNGGVRNFAAGGPVLGQFEVSTPYALHSASGTGFTFDGPH